MLSSPDYTSAVRRLIFLIAGSIVLLMIYYVQYRPKPVHPRHSSEYTATLPTIVVFRREPENVKRNCNPPEPGKRTDQHSWQRLDPNGYLYSAHLDNRTDTPLVRIVALLKGYAGRQLFCWTWPDRKLSPVSMKELWVRAWDAEAPGRYFHPYLLSCPASGTVHAVSVVYDVCLKPSNLLNVTSGNHQKSKKFAVCVKPMNFTENITPRILEWFELQFLLGADNVLVYVHHLHSDTRRTLQHYAGRVTIVDHSPPATDQQTNWTSLWQRRRLEVALYNDCFYRYVQSHQFVVNLDLDEAIVPMVNDTWIELLEVPAFQHSASVSVRNVYFFDSLGVDSSVPSHLHMLRHVYRSANFTPPGFAQKSFFNTQYAEAVAHHYALRALLRPGGIRLMSGVDMSRARLHHYRSQCPKLMEKQCANNFMKYKVRDTAIWRFKEVLQAAVAGRMKELGLDLLHLAENSTVVD